jgi:hypothetical protein
VNSGGIQNDRERFLGSEVVELHQRLEVLDNVLGRLVRIDRIDLLQFFVDLTVHDLLELSVKNTLFDLGGLHFGQ